MSSTKKPQPQKVIIETKKVSDEKPQMKHETIQVEVRPLMFDKSNYQLMLLGVFFILIGFALMSGGASTDPTVFDTNEVYSFRRITLAPMMVILGFVIEIYAIFKGKSNS